MSVRVSERVSECLIEIFSFSQLGNFRGEIRMISPSNARQVIVLRFLLILSDPTWNFHIICMCKVFSAP